MNRYRFEHVWRLVLATFDRNQHCLVLGCGRDTLTHWVRESNLVPGHTSHYIPPNELRRHMLGAHRQGLVLMLREPGRCTRFHLLRRGNLP